MACMWSNFRHAGVDRLIVSRVLEARSLLRHLAEAVPGARITVIRLRVRPEVLEARIRAREAGDPEWFLGAAAYLAEALERAGVEDHVVDNDDRPAADAAREALRLAGWLEPQSPTAPS
jgi:predicted kinase